VIEPPVLVGVTVFISPTKKVTLEGYVKVEGATSTTEMFRLVVIEPPELEIFKVTSTAFEKVRGVPDIIPSDVRMSPDGKMPLMML